MKNINLIGVKLTIFLLISLLNGCNISTNTTSAKDITKNQLKEVKSKNHQPILVIWKEEEGSVPIRGEHLYFRLFDDGFFEFDYITSKKTEPSSPRLTFSLQKTPLTKLSEDEFREVKSMLKILTDDRDIKKEYKSVANLMDVSAKMKFLLKENRIIKKKIIANDSDIIIMEKPERFPNSISKLVKTIYMVRVNLKGT